MGILPLNNLANFESGFLKFDWLIIKLVKKSNNNNKQGTLWVRFPNKLFIPNVFKEEHIIST